jgi:prephenate dehydrogenase
MPVKWKRVTIVGCGLIGGSFALALKHAGLCESIAGWDISNQVIEEALRLKVIDEVDQAFNIGEKSSSDLIYLAMPVSGIIEFLKTRGNQIGSGTVVTDTGSTKAEICSVAQEYLPHASQFIGGHPIAGSHFAGLTHARADLFQDAPYVLIVDERGDGSDNLSRLKETINSIGARVETLTSTGHDRVFAMVSHLPQLLSSALAATIKDQPDAVALMRLSGSGYKDMTRLSASSWSIWQDIFKTNRTELAQALELLIDKLIIAHKELEAKSETDLSTINQWFEKRSFD